MPALGLGYAARAGWVTAAQVPLILSTLAVLFAAARATRPRAQAEIVGLVASLGGVVLLAAAGGRNGLAATGLIVLGSIAGPRVAYAGPIRRVDWFHYAMAAAMLLVGGLRLTAV
jgi:hypothetical protein